MNVPNTSLDNIHFPVMLNEVIKICEPEKGGNFLDCTFGGGGYTKEILKFPNTKVISFDRDNFVINIAKK
jgi:16S rRNA (cytosine1402-N4)-methyltransferase